ncbi:MAG: hypothetical protein LAO19_21325 [Acidobacteriia bacterium]|nr:hypothetical protein [Terriglobia bacterium]
MFTGFMVGRCNGISWEIAGNICQNREEKKNPIFPDRANHLDTPTVATDLDETFG